MSPASCHPQQAPITQRRRRHGLPDTSVSAAKGTGVPCPLPAFPGGAATGSGTCLAPQHHGGTLAHVPEAGVPRRRVPTGAKSQRVAQVSSFGAALATCVVPKPPRV